jgi:hypothetical protein
VASQVFWRVQLFWLRINVKMLEMKLLGFQSRSDHRQPANCRRVRLAAVCLNAANQDKREKSVVLMFWTKLYKLMQRKDSE